MEAIINDLKSAYEKLNSEIAKAEKKTAELNVLIEKENAKLSDIVSRETALKAQENKYKTFDSAEVMVKSANDLRASVNSEKAEINARASELAKKSLDVEEKQKHLDQMIGIYKNKQEKCDAYKAQLEKDRAEMKQSIIAELQKGLK